MWHYLKLTLIVAAYAVLAFNALVIAAGAIYVGRKTVQEPQSRPAIGREATTPGLSV